MKSTRSFAGKVAKGIWRRLADPGLEVQGSVIYRPGFRVVLRGVLVETTAYKHTIRLRDLHAVLLDPTGRMNIGFSPEIAVRHGEQFRTMLTGTVPELVEEATAALSASAVLQGMDDDAASMQFQEMLEDLSRRSNDLSVTALLAAVSLLNNNDDLARQAYLKCSAIMDGIDFSKAPPWHLASMEKLRSEISQASADIDLLRQRLSVTMRENARQMGLKPQG